MANALTYWENHLARKRPDTVKNYRKHFDRFLERNGLTADELYEMQKRAEAAEDPRETGEVAELAVEHIRWMEAEGYKAGTIENFVTAVNVFFQVNKLGFEIPREEIPVADYDGQNVITKGQMRTAWDRAGEEFRLRNRSMLMLGKDLGLRIGDMAKITVLEYLEAEDLTGKTFPVEEDGGEIQVPGDGFKRWVKPIVTEKKKRNAYPHIGPEAVEALDAYIEERRQRSGKKYTITHGSKTEMRTYPTYDPSQKLFLGRAGRPLSKEALGQQFQRLFGAWVKVSAHSLRKYHRTMLEGAGMPEGWVKKLQGKAASVYSQPEKTGHLTGKYIRCYHALRVFTKVDLGEVETLRGRLEAQNKKIQELEDERKQITALARRIEELEKRF